MTTLPRQFTAHAADRRPTSVPCALPPIDSGTCPYCRDKPKEQGRAGCADCVEGILRNLKTGNNSRVGSVMVNGGGVVPRKQEAKKWN